MSISLSRWYEICYRSVLDLLFCDVILTVKINYITPLCDVSFIDSGMYFFLKFYFTGKNLIKSY